MNKLYPLIGVLLIALTISCTGTRLSSADKVKEKELMGLVKLMSGKFSSKEQSQKDSLFYDINLVMHPIWESQGTTKWLYVEQAVSSNMKKPYRQRVYRLSKAEDGVFESRVYELPTPAKYIHGWEKPEIFSQITPDSLILREGCAVFLEKEQDCYQGSTKDKDCKSTLRGAQYATSNVTICADQVMSWDQGWNGEDAQVWGAQTEGYVFKRY